MNQELELELTFLAKELPESIKTIKPTRIVDIYIPDTSEHSRLRLRQKGEKYEITKKMPVKEENASEQIEQTIPLTKVLMDFEFNTIEEKSAFKMPGVALVDVTQEDFIAGGLLAGKTYNDIVLELKRFNYKQIEQL